MNITSSALRPQRQLAQKPAPAPAKAPEENISFSSNDGISWGGAAIGLVSGVAGGVVTGLGAGLTSIKHSIAGTGEAYKALWTNETIGPVLKTAIGTLLPVATVGVPILAAVGGAAVGLYTGFVEGASNGLSAAISESVNDVKDFNNELAPDVRQGIREFGNETLEEGEERFDISPLGGVTAVAAGLGNTVVGAVGIGASTLSQIPEAFITGNRAINASDMGIPMKTVSHVVSLPLAAVAAPLGVIGGALFGLGAGAYHGYNDGFADSFKKTGEYVGDYHQYVAKGLDELAEDLVDPNR